MGEEDGYVYVVGVLSDYGGFYLYSDSSNVFKKINLFN